MPARVNYSWILSLKFSKYSFKYGFPNRTTSVPKNTTEINHMIELKDPQASPAENEEPIFSEFIDPLGYKPGPYPGLRYGSIGYNLPGHILFPFKKVINPPGEFFIVN